MSQKVQKIRGTDFPKTTVSRIKSKNPASISDEIYNESGKLAYVIAKAKQRISKEYLQSLEDTRKNQFLKCVKCPKASKEVWLEKQFT